MLAQVVQTWLNLTCFDMLQSWIFALYTIWRLWFNSDDHNKWFDRMYQCITLMYSSGSLFCQLSSNYQTYPKRIQAWWTDELWGGNRIEHVESTARIEHAMILLLFHSSFIIQLWIASWIIYHWSLINPYKPCKSFVQILCKQLPSLTRGHGTMKYW